MRHDGERFDRLPAGVERRCPKTDRIIPEVDAIYQRLEGKVKVWLGFPSSWMDDLRRTIAEVLYESCLERGIPETVRRAEVLLEGRQPIVMKSSKTQTMPSGIKVPVWSEGPFEGREALKTLLTERLNESRSPSRGSADLDGAGRSGASKLLGEFGSGDSSVQVLGREVGRAGLEHFAGRRSSQIDRESLPTSREGGFGLGGKEPKESKKRGA